MFWSSVLIAFITLIVVFALLIVLLRTNASALQFSEAIEDEVDDDEQEYMLVQYLYPEVRPRNYGKPEFTELTLRVNNPHHLHLSVFQPNIFERIRKRFFTLKRHRRVVIYFTEPEGVHDPVWEKCPALGFESDPDGLAQIIRLQFGRELLLLLKADGYVWLGLNGDKLQLKIKEVTKDDDELAVFYDLLSAIADEVTRYEPTPYFPDMW